MMCALQAGRRGRKVLLLDHANRPGNKIRISGGGHCNFTNREVSSRHYVSKNPHFCKSAISRYTSESFIQLLKEYGITFEEREHGQLFCTDSAENIVTLLKSECDKTGADFKFNCLIQQIAEHFKIITTAGTFSSQSLVIASGGISYPKVSATGLGYEIARQFGINVTDTAPALVGFTFDDAQTGCFRELSGISLETDITCNKVSSRGNLLFTHTGLSGPSILQASLYWNPGDEITINLLPRQDCFEFLIRKKEEGSHSFVKNLLGELIPNRLANYICARHVPPQLPILRVSDKMLADLSKELHSWKVHPAGTSGFSKAEVTRGGVDTNELSSKTMESRKISGLYFIGEVVDVTGWLGGYNLQWAWSSGWAAGQAV